MLTIRDLLAFMLFGMLLFPTCLARRLAPWLWPAFTGTPDDVVGEQKNKAAIQLLRSWREGNEQEQRETWECLGQALGVRVSSAKCQDATANRAARVMYDALVWIGDEAAAAIATESVMDDKQALALILLKCQEALR